MGDDINKFFFEFASGKKVAALPVFAPFLPKRKHYSLVGSILGSYPLKNCTVYGTGLMNAANIIMDKSREIISVRGPQTRNALIAQGIDCPENYGDPALLLHGVLPAQAHKLK